MGKEFYEWIFRTNPNRWDAPGGIQGVDSFIKNSLEMFTGLPLKIVDLGCGNGRTLEHIYKPEWDCWGIDYVPEAINQAKKKMGRKITFVVGDMTQTGLSSKSFDVVYSCGAFEHLDFPKFDEPYRLLKPGGLFLCTLTNGTRGKVETDFCIQNDTGKNDAIWGKQWEWEFPKEEWIKMLESSGFEVIYSNDSGEFACHALEKK